MLSTDIPDVRLCDDAKVEGPLYVRYLRSTKVISILRCANISNVV